MVRKNLTTWHISPRPLTPHPEIPHLTKPLIWCSLQWYTGLFRSHTTLLLAIPFIIVFRINGIVLNTWLEIFSLKPFPLPIKMIGRMTVFGSWTYWIFGGSKWHKSTIMSTGHVEWNIMMIRSNHQHTHFTNRTKLTPANMSTDKRSRKRV